MTEEKREIYKDMFDLAWIVGHVIFELKLYKTFPQSTVEKLDKHYTEVIDKLGDKLNKLSADSFMGSAREK